MEYLLTGLEPENSPRRTMPDSLQKYQKHRLLIDELDSLPPNVQESIGNMIREVKQACTEPA